MLKKQVHTYVQWSFRKQMQNDETNLLSFVIFNGETRTLKILKMPAQSLQKTLFCCHVSMKNNHPDTKIF